jgi:hypothetical protein
MSVHQPADLSKMTWPPVVDLLVTGTPEMPPMGDGCSRNVNPVHTGDGLSTDTVYFSVAGEWVLHLDFKAGDTSLAMVDSCWNLWRHGFAAGAGLAGAAAPLAGIDSRDR